MMAVSVGLSVSVGDFYKVKDAFISNVSLPALLLISNRF